MSDLTEKKCKACNSETPALAESDIQNLLKQLHDWRYDSSKKLIAKKYEFKNYYQTMSFVNAIAWIAHKENHHPNLSLGYNYCTVSFHTHAIKGLSENDFICAAKIDAFM